MRSLSALLVSALLLPAAGQTSARIVSTSPSITETLYALGLGSRVAGVTTYCNFPPEAKTKPRVGTFLEPDYERILSLKPDLVLVIKNPVQVTARLRSFGLKAEDVDMDNVQSVLSATMQIARLTGRAAEGQRLADSLKRQLDEVKKAGSKGGATSVLFLVGRAPGTLQNMVGAGPGTFLDELLKLAGGRNVLASSPIQYPKVSLEQIMATDPDVIIDMGDYAHAENTADSRRREELALWRAHPQLKAVRSGRIHAVTAAHFVVPGPRMGDAARDFLRFLHPEAVTGAKPPGKQ